MIKKICVVGLGYVGLPTASVLANRGLEVVGVDTNEEVVQTIRQGKIHLTEPELDVMVHAATLSGKLRVSSKPEPADLYVITVPTPFKGNFKPDLSYIEEAARSIAPLLTEDNLAILESTSPIGTTSLLAEWFCGLRPDLSFGRLQAKHVHLAYCPERVLPGQIIREIVQNDRVIGGLSPCCGEKAADFYRLFIEGECHLVDAKTAEMVKLAENTFRDVNIALANELSLICDRVDINTWDLIRLANRHPRVRILQPGPGVGGHCVAVDPWFLVNAAPDLAHLIRTAREVNERKTEETFQRIKREAKRLKPRAIACLGLSFKADIDDLRESPALKIVQKLAQEKLGTLLVVEPHIQSLPPSLEKFPQISLLSLESALRESDLIVGLVSHKQFLHLDRRLLEGKNIIDTRGMWA